MTIAKIVAELNCLVIRRAEDYKQLDRLNELTAFLRQNHDGHPACEVLLTILERHPQVDFGAPGQLVHTIESYRGHYEDSLVASLNNPNSSCRLRTSHLSSESFPRSSRVKRVVIDPAASRITERTKQVNKVGPSGYGSGSTC
jgi:hypothetical protein